VMRSLPTVLTALLLSQFAVPLGAQVMTLTPSKDAYISQEKIDAPGDRSHRNFGGAPALRADTQYNGEKSHVLLGFDMGDLAGKAIERAVLVMGPPVDPKVGTTMGIEIRRLLASDWVEGEHGDKTHKDKAGVSWHARAYDQDGMPLSWDKPGAMGEADSDAAGAVKVSMAQVNEVTDPGVDVTALVKAWQEAAKTAEAGKKPQFGLLIRTTNDKINYVGWPSKEAASGVPKLMVTVGE